MRYNKVNCTQQLKLRRRLCFQFSLIPLGLWHFHLFHCVLSTLTLLLYCALAQGSFFMLVVCSKFLILLPPLSDFCGCACALLALSTCLLFLLPLLLLLEIGGGIYFGQSAPGGYKMGQGLLQSRLLLERRRGYNYFGQSQFLRGVQAEQGGFSSWQVPVALLRSTKLSLNQAPSFDKAWIVAVNKRFLCASCCVCAQKRVAEEVLQYQYEIVSLSIKGLS